jgi:hypothetical protein
MRVSGVPGGEAGMAAIAARRARFDDALRLAESPGASARHARTGWGRPGGAAPDWRGDGDRSGAVLAQLAAGTARPPPAPAEPASHVVPLAAALRMAPPQIEALLRSGRPMLLLDFGREVSIELRQGKAGVELVLAVAPALTGAARAGLAGLREALAARGLALARAEVRQRGGRAGRDR